jgi:hypothetical protein
VPIGHAEDREVVMRAPQVLTCLTLFGLVQDMPEWAETYPELAQLKNVVFEFLGVAN